MKQTLLILTLLCLTFFNSKSVHAQNCVNGIETICGTTLSEVTANIGIVELSITNVLIAGFSVTPISTSINLASITDLGGGCIQFAFLCTMSSNPDAVIANTSLGMPLFKTVHDIDLQSNAPTFLTATTTTAGLGVVSCTGGCPNTGIPPVAVCQPHTVYLDGIGSGTLTSNDIDGGSTDDCGIVSYMANQMAFTCGDLGSFANMVIIAAYDGPLPGGLPKGIEVYVINNIADLSMYGMGSANNGGGTDGEEFTFPAISASAGTFIYISSDSADFNNWFGFNTDYVTSAANINGNDAIELFYNGGVIDVFGDINVDGTGEPWEYMDGWAYRNSGTGPDGTTFVLGNWSFSGKNALDGETSNSSAGTPVPIGTYTSSGGGIPVMLIVQDAETLMDSCVAMVTVLDTVSPTITCPANIAVCEGDTVVFSTPIGADNCTLAMVNQTDGSGLSSGMVFPVGTTTIEFTSTDGSGNTAICSFDVDVTAVDTAVMANGTDTLTSNAVVATYQWLDCNNGNAIIVGATNATYVAPASGSFSVQVTQNGCVDTSSCYNILITKVDELSSNIGWSIYPNPVVGNVMLYFGNTGYPVNVSIVDVTGKEVYSVNEVAEHKIEVNTKDFSKGIYFVRIQNDRHQKVIKLIKR